MKRPLPGLMRRGEIFYVQRWIRGAPRRKSLRTRSEAEARTRYWDTRRALEEEAAKAPGDSPAISAHFATMLERVWAGRTWIKQARTALEEAEEILGPLRSIASLTAADLQHLSSVLHQRQRAPSTIGLRLTLVQQALLLGGAPPEIFIGLRKPKSPPRQRVLEEEEEPGLFEALPEPERSLARFLLLTGLRLAEGLAARPEALSARGWLRVVGKGRKVRQIPLSLPAQALLHECRWEGLHRERLGAALRTLGLGITPHTLRHTFATRLADRGVSPKVLAALLGDSVGITMRYYVTARPKALEEAVRGSEPRPEPRPPQETEGELEHS